MSGNGSASANLIGQSNGVIPNTIYETTAGLVMELGVAEHVGGSAYICAHSPTRFWRAHRTSICAFAPRVLKSRVACTSAFALPGPPLAATSGLSLVGAPTFGTC